MPVDNPVEKLRKLCEKVVGLFRKSIEKGGLFHKSCGPQGGPKLRTTTLNTQINKLINFPERARRAWKAFCQEPQPEPCLIFQNFAGTYHVGPQGMKRTSQCYLDFGTGKAELCCTEISFDSQGEVASLRFMNLEEDTKLPPAERPGFLAGDRHGL